MDWSKGKRTVTFKYKMRRVIATGSQAGLLPSAWERAGWEAEVVRLAGALDKLLDGRLAMAFPLDANDVLYMWDASRDYNPSPALERIQATVLAINSADDERNPPETGIMEHELKRVKNARLFLIPGSENTAGHLTTSMAKFWKQPLEELLSESPRGK
jgi:homoserine acetyltransferase